MKTIALRFYCTLLLWRAMRESLPRTIRIYIVRFDGFYWTRQTHTVAKDRKRGEIEKIWFQERTCRPEWSQSLSVRFNSNWSHKAGRTIWPNECISNWNWCWHLVWLWIEAGCSHECEPLNATTVNVVSVLVRSTARTCHLTDWFPFFTIYINII